MQKGLLYYIQRAVLLSLFFLALPFGAHALTLTPVRHELRGDPGETIRETVTLINEKSTGETFYTSFANFEAEGESGSPSFVEPIEGVGTWIVTNSSVYVAPNSSKEVELSITIPKSANPGGYFGAVFFGTSPSSSAGEVAIGSKIGVLVLLTVNGEVSKDGGVLEFATKDMQKWYTALPVPLYYRFQNAGGDRIKPEGEILVRNLIGLIAARIPANQVQGNILPSSTRRFEVLWQSKHGSSEPHEGGLGFFQAVSYQWNNFAFGRYVAHLDLTHSGNELHHKAKYSFWVFPWQLLIVVGVGLLVFVTLLRKGLARYNAWIIKKARISLDTTHQNNSKEK